MRVLIVFFLLFVTGVMNAQPDVQIFFPDQAAVVDGQYINPTRGLVVKTIDGVVSTDTLDLADIVDFTLPENTAVTGFSAINNGGDSTATFSYLFSFATATDSYIRGDVIECESNGCELFDSFGMNATISSLDYINRGNDLYVAFDTSFEVNGNWIEPADVYRASDFSVVFDSSAAGLSENNAITAFDTSELAPTISPLSMAEISGELIKPSGVYNPFVDVTNSVVDELSDNVSAVNAYYSADTGWIEFDQEVINVNENAGSISFNMKRVGGLENDLSVVVRDVDGTAQDGIDYQGILSQFFFVDNGSDDIAVTMNLIDNNDQDGARSFTIDLVEVNDDFIFSMVNTSSNLITVNIIDDDGDLIFADDFE